MFQASAATNPSEAVISVANFSVISFFMLEHRLRVL